MKQKHKLTPDAHKQIKESAAVLPPLVRLNKDGSDRTRAVTKTYKGSELPEGVKLSPGVAFNPNKLYVQRFNEPVYVNHEVEMVNAFWSGGEPAVKDYINKVVEISKKSRKEVLTKA